MRWSQGKSELNLATICRLVEAGDTSTMDESNPTTGDNVADGFWSLFQGTDQIRIDGLRLVQVHALTRAFSATGLEDWFAWHEGAKDWAPLADMVSVINGAGKLFNLPPVPPKIGQPQETITRSLARDGRLIPRFKMNLEALVDYKGKVIKSQTVDISLGGMKIKDPLPFPANAIVLVTLINGRAELAMRCRLVESANTPARHRLLIETCHRMDLLRRWILKAEPQK